MESEMGKPLYALTFCDTPGGTSWTSRTRCGWILDSAAYWFGNSKPQVWFGL